MTDNPLKTNPQERPAFTKPKKRWPLYTAAGFLAFLLLLPVGIRMGAEYALKELGAETASIDDVDLNLFTGYFAIKGLQLTYQQQPTLVLDKLAVNIGMLSLLRQRILLEEVEISGLAVQIFQQADQWVAGIPLPESDNTEVTEEETTEASGWTFGVNNIALHDIAITARYQEQTHSLKLDKLLAGDLWMWAPQQRGKFSINGSINDAPLQIQSGLTPFAQTQSFTVHIDLQQLQLDALQGFLPEDITRLMAALSVKTDISLTLNANGDITATQQGYIALAVNELAMPDISLAAEDIRWDGKVNATITGDEQPVIDAEGTASINALNVQYLPLLISTTLTQLQWQGSANVALDNTEQSLAVTGDIVLDNWHLYDQQQEADLLNFKQLALNTLQVQGLPNIRLKKIQLQQLHALQTNEQRIAALGNIHIQDIQLSQLNALAIATVELDSLNVAVKRNEHGKLLVLDDWLASLQQRLDAQPKTPADSEGTTTDSSESAFSYRIDQIRFSGDNQIVFADQGVTPAISHPVVIEKIDIGRIDSSQPDQLTPLDIALKLYRYGSFTVAGEISPLQETALISGAIKADIKGIELTDLSPYLENSIGYQANSGQLNVSTNARINQGQLDSETGVNILRIKLEPANEELIAKASQTLTMPVGTALMVITDSNNTLKLTVPVKGDLSNPDIKLGRIASGAVIQAVKNSAMTYFKYAVQPFGAIMLVSQTISDMHLQARFEDVRFNAGTADIVDEQSGYLEKVAGMIQDKKNFSVVACVVITDEDFLARSKPPALAEGQTYQWDEASQNLAEQRLDIIRSTLINQHGLATDQIQSCKATLGSGTPRAIMGI